MVVAIMKRKTDAEFEMPQQHLYAGDNISSDEIANRYKWTSIVSSKTLSQKT